MIEEILQQVGLLLLASTGLAGALAWDPTPALAVALPKFLVDQVLPYFQ